jgi:hypothetical protein
LFKQLVVKLGLICAKTGLKLVSRTAKPVLKKDVLHMFCTGIQNFKSIMMGQILGQT